MHIKDIQKTVHKTAIDHGWWEGTTKENCEIGTKIALMHSELSEALEEHRSFMPTFYRVADHSEPRIEYSKPEGIVVELADCIIRILDLAGFMEWDIENALREKMKYNDKREYRHGGKKI